MKFAILVYEETTEFEDRSQPGQAEEYWGAYKLYSQSLVEAGIMAGGNALQGPEVATTVRLKAGQSVVADGPFADVKEQLGGLFVSRSFRSLHKPAGRSAPLSARYGLGSR